MKRAALKNVRHQIMSSTHNAEILRSICFLSFEGNEATPTFCTDYSVSRLGFQTNIRIIDTMKNGQTI